MTAINSDKPCHLQTQEGKGVELDLGVCPMGEGVGGRGE